MSQTTPMNYLAHLSTLRTIPDVRSRIALLALTAPATVLPLVQIVIPATGQGMVLHLGQLSGLGGWSWLPIAACAALLVAPIVPSLAKFVRAADIGLAVAFIAIAWFAWAGYEGAWERVDRVAAFGVLINDTYAPATGWRWGLPPALAALGLSVWRGGLALVRPLHA